MVQRKNANHMRKLGWVDAAQKGFDIMSVKNAEIKYMQKVLE